MSVDKLFADEITSEKLFIEALVKLLKGGANPLTLSSTGKNIFEIANQANWNATAVLKLINLCVNTKKWALMISLELIQFICG